jgi:hypothetical protein
MGGTLSLQKTVSYKAHIDIIVISRGILLIIHIRVDYMTIGP